MIRRDPEAGQAIFQRDLLRDFCFVYSTLDEQRGRFAVHKNLSYPIISELLGRGMLKGVFWRLKDTAHHLFRRSRGYGKEAAIRQGYTLTVGAAFEPPISRLNYDTRMSGGLDQPVLEALLDWSIGYAFHECVRLKESAYQDLHYSLRLRQLRELESMSSRLSDPLVPLVEETGEELRRQLDRTLAPLAHARTLLIQYLSGYDENPFIARFLFDCEKMAGNTFKEQLQELIDALYKGKPERKFILAARAYLDGGRPGKALNVLDNAALNISPGEEATTLRELILYNFR